MGSTNSKVTKKLLIIEQFINQIFLISLYKSSRRKVFHLIEMQLKRRFHVRYLWAFGTDNLVRPLNNMGKLILKYIESPTEQMWAYCTWKSILGIQMDKASDLKEKFAGGIEVILKNLEQLPISDTSL